MSRQLGVAVGIVGSLAEIGFFALLSYATIIAEGALRWFLSPMSAARVVE